MVRINKSFSPAEFSSDLTFVCCWQHCTVTTTMPTKIYLMCQWTNLNQLMNKKSSRQCLHQSAQFLFLTCAQAV